MNGSLLVDPAEVLRLGTDMQRTADALTGPLPTLSAGQVGNADVAAALSEFATNWDKHRAEVVGWISALATMLTTAGTQYAATEQTLIDGATFDGPSTIARNPTPSPGSGSDGGPGSHAGYGAPGTDPYVSRFGGQVGLSNGRIADLAEQEVTATPDRYYGQIGYNQPGECKVAMARWLRSAGGTWTGGGGALGGYEGAGAIDIPIDHLSRGDVIQRFVGDGTTWDGAHTAVVLSVDPANPRLVTVAESNYDWHGSMRIAQYDLGDPGSTKTGQPQQWRGFRLGGKP